MSLRYLKDELLLLKYIKLYNDEIQELWSGILSLIKDDVLCVSRSHGYSKKYTAVREHLYYNNVQFGQLT